MVTYRRGNDMLNQVSCLLRDIDPEPGIKTPRLPSQTDLEEIPLDELQQFPNNAESTSVDGVPKPISSSAVHFRNSEGIVMLPNQDTTTGIGHVDIRTSLSFRFSQSQWMSIVMWFFCLQFLAVVVTILLFMPGIIFIIVDKPSSLLKSSVFSGFVVQPMNCFIAVVLGLYISDDRLSRFQLTLLCILLFIFLSGWGVVTVLPFMVDVFKWYYALGPLIITVIQFIYLSLR